MGAKFDIIVNQWQLKVKLGKLHERQENASDEISIGLKSKVKQNQSSHGLLSTLLKNWYKQDSLVSATMQNFIELLHLTRNLGILPMFEWSSLFSPFEINVGNLARL